MSLGDENAPHLMIVQLNADLRSAQLDLLSAQCATDRLRLRFSPEHLARHGDRDLLRKAFSSATALHDFYRSIEKAIQAFDAKAAENDVAPSP
jgi:hypothetical protein